MPTYYCRQCYTSLELLPHQAPSASLTGTHYQLERFIKHTDPTGTYSINSVFDDPTYSAYRDYIVTGTMSGFLEVDDRNRNNLIWYAGKSTGIEYQDGVFSAPTNGVKIVLSHDETRIHAFPIASQPNLINYCQNCGTPIPMW
jgi:hypothetical protein